MAAEFIVIQMPARELTACCCERARCSRPPSLCSHPPNRLSNPLLPFEHRELLIQGRRSGIVVLSTIGALLCAAAAALPCFRARGECVALAVRGAHASVCPSDFKKLWPRAVDKVPASSSVISLAASRGVHLPSPPPPPHCPSQLQDIAPCAQLHRNAAYMPLLPPK